MPPFPGIGTRALPESPGAGGAALALAEDSCGPPGPENPGVGVVAESEGGQVPFMPAPVTCPFQS